MWITCLFGSALRRHVCLQRSEQVMGDGRNVVDSLKEGDFIGFGGLGEATNLADELERGRVDLIVSRRWLEVE